MNGKRSPDAPIPHSKACDLPGDARDLAPFYSHLDHIPDVLASQHPIRRWEYAMTLRTIHRWMNEDAPLYPGALQIADVGGAGSNFWKVLGTLSNEPVLIVDAACPPAGSIPATHNNQTVALHPSTVETYAATAAHGQFDILTSISVIEHVESITPFLRACHMLLKSGGLLCLTTDYCDSEGPDIYHFHWMRHRIYNAESVRKLLVRARELGFRSFGEADWSYPGPMVYDYSVASIALVKK